MDLQSHEEKSFLILDLINLVCMYAVMRVKPLQKQLTCPNLFSTRLYIEHNYLFVRSESSGPSGGGGDYRPRRSMTPPPYGGGGGGGSRYRSRSPIDRGYERRDDYR